MSYPAFLVEFEQPIVNARANIHRRIVVVVFEPNVQRLITGFISVCESKHHALRPNDHRETAITRCQRVVDNNLPKQIVKIAIEVFLEISVHRLHHPMWVETLHKKSFFAHERSPSFWTLTRSRNASTTCSELNT